LQLRTDGGQADSSRAARPARLAPC
jgi:hypothetical protein